MLTIYAEDDVHELCNKWIWWFKLWSKVFFSFFFFVSFTYALRTSCIISKNCDFDLLRLASSFAFWSAKRFFIPKRLFHIFLLIILWNTLKILKIEKQQKNKKQEWMEKNRTDKKNSNATKRTLHPMFQRLTLLRLFWNKRVIWPSFKFSIISLAEWWGDTSSNVLMKRYNFCWSK